MPKCTVVREGGHKEIDAGDLVPGDIVVLDEGQAVPADLRLCQVIPLEIVVIVVIVGVMVVLVVVALIVVVITVVVIVVVAKVLVECNASSKDRSSPVFHTLTAVPSSPAILSSSSSSLWRQVSQLAIVETLLTGESVPIEKKIDEIHGQRRIPIGGHAPARSSYTHPKSICGSGPGQIVVLLSISCYVLNSGDRLCMAFQSTTVSRGRGIGVVVNTGQTTEVRPYGNSIVGVV